MKTLIDEGLRHYSLDDELRPMTTELVAKLLGAPGEVAMDRQTSGIDVSIPRELVPILLDFLSLLATKQKGAALVLDYGQIVTALDASALLGIPSKQTQAMIRSGALPRIFINGRARMRMSDIVELLGTGCYDAKRQEWVSHTAEP